MRVLVTRAEPAASRTAERLRALGHEPVVMSLSHAVHDPEAVRDAMSHPVPALAITSAEVIRVLARAGVDVKPWREVPLFAVGPTTAEAARKFGFQNVTAGSGGGRELAEMIAPLLAGRTNREHPLLYLTGTPRSQGFENRLDELHVPYAVCECYRTEELEPGAETLRLAFGEQPIDAVLLYSANSARRLFSLPALNADADVLKRVRFFCLSRVVADVLPFPHAANAAVALRPDEMSLLELLPPVV